MADLEIRACPFCTKPWPRDNGDGTFSCLETSTCPRYGQPFSVTV